MGHFWAVRVPSRGVELKITKVIFRNLLTLLAELFMWTVTPQIDGRALIEGHECSKCSGKEESPARMNIIYK